MNSQLWWYVAALTTGKVGATTERVLRNLPGSSPMMNP